MGYDAVPTFSFYLNLKIHVNVDRGGLIKHAISCHSHFGVQYEKATVRSTYSRSDYQ